MNARRFLDVTLLLSALQYGALAGTCPFLSGVDPITKELNDLKLKFVGVTPTVTRKTAEGKPKIVITKYSHTPSFEEVKDGTLFVKPDSCMAGATTTKAASSGTKATTDDVSFAAGMSRPSLLAMTAMTFAATKRSPALGFTACILAAVSAQASSCDTAMEVEVHGPMTQAAVDAFVCKKEKAGQFRDCPAESVYYKFHKDVYGGYEGCVSDSGMNPCPQDGFGGPSKAVSLANGGFNKPYEWDDTTKTCKKVRELKDEILWILWGHPMDTHELVTRTKMNPVVYLPLTRAGYPSYSASSHGDELLDAKAVEKDFQVYLGAFTKSELDKFELFMTEGTEQGMYMLYAAMMVHIAQTSCNRKIHLLVEAPTYGYNMGASVDLANSMASSFLNHSKCSCFATDSCKTKSLTLTRHGWFAGKPLPTAKGDDGQDYAASSTSADSPWMERMVWPENPTGETRTRQGPTNRLVCDGCYVYPMYFPDATPPVAKKPACAAWAFSLTKAYSAVMRSGTTMTLKDHPITGIMNDLHGTVHSIYNGYLSDFVWRGSVQVKTMIMNSGAINSPTSWVGAYVGLMKEKWTVMTEAIKTCSFLELTNGPSLTGGYLWMKKTGDYRCKNSGWKDSFFLEVLGVETTSYNFGFRGATASDYYGAGTCNDDFTRMQLYRDINIYKEVARRMKIACGGGNVEHSAGKWLTPEEWKTSKTASSRRLAETKTHPATVEERMEHLKKDIPRLTDVEARILAENQHKTHQIQMNIDKHCAPQDYPQSCLFKYMGHSGDDVTVNEFL